MTTGEKRYIPPPQRARPWVVWLRGFVHVHLLVPFSLVYSKWTGDVIKESGIYALPFNLLLKRTPGTLEEEALAMSLAFKMGLPVPRLISYGEYDDKTSEFPSPPGSIVMTRIPGQTLDNVLYKLLDHEREAIANDLGDILRKMRRFANPFGERTCNVVGGDIRSLRATRNKIAACADFAAFHKEVAWAADPGTENYELHCENYSRLLKKPYDVVFTHGDLLCHNIMVDKGRITGIIDWECAGWLPEYWDFTSMLRGPRRNEDDAWLRLWRTIPLNKYDEEHESERSLWIITQDSWSYWG